MTPNTAQIILLVLIFDSLLRKMFSCWTCDDVARNRMRTIIPLLFHRREQRRQIGRGGSPNRPWAIEPIAPSCVVHFGAGAAASFWKRGSFRSGSNIGSSRSSAGV